MNKRFASLAGAVILTFSTAGLALAQDTPTTTTTTTTVSKTIQNPDGTYSIIEYPVGKQVVVNLSPTTLIPGAKGTATIIRNGDASTINLDLAGLQEGDSYTVYAVDPTGGVTMLGPVTVTNGAATASFTTPLNKFMIFLSPEGNLSAYGADTKVILRSTVPSGFAVVPVSESRPKTDAVHEKATTTSSAGGYTAPMLGVRGFKMNAWNRLRIRFADPALAGSTATVLVRPRSDMTTEIHANFHHLKKTDAVGSRIVLWAVSPDNTYTRLGQVVDTGDRNKADIHTETSLRDFGLFITIESGRESAQPAGQIIGTITVAS
jgi:hypothetical protein